MKSENNLPLELLLIIVEHMEQTDIISFSSMSNYYRSLLIPISFRKIKVNGPNSKFSVSKLLQQSDGNFLINIGSGLRNLEYFRREYDTGFPTIFEVFEELDLLLKLCPNLKKLLFFGNWFDSIYEFYFPDCSSDTIAIFYSDSRIGNSYRSQIVIHSFGQIRDLVFVTKAALIGDYTIRMNQSPHYLLCFPNLEVLSLRGFSLDTHFLERIQFLPKLTKFISINYNVKDQYGHTKLYPKKQIPEASISYSNKIFNRLRWQYTNKKKHFFEEVFVSITESSNCDQIDN